MEQNKQYCTGQGVPGSIDFYPATEKKKNASYSVKVRVIDPKRTAFPEGREFMVFLYNHTPKAAEHMAKVLRWLGATTEGLANGSGDGIGSTKVDLCIYDDEYEGTVSQKCSVWPVKPKRELTAYQENEKNLALANLIALADPISIEEHNFADPEALPERAFEERTEQVEQEASPF